MPDHADSHSCWRDSPPAHQAPRPLIGNKIACIQRATAGPSLDIHHAGHLDLFCAPRLARRGSPGLLLHQSARAFPRTRTTTPAQPTVDRRNESSPLLPSTGCVGCVPATLHTHPPLASRPAFRFFPSNSPSLPSRSQRAARISAQLSTFFCCRLPPVSNPPASCKALGATTG